MHINFSRDAKKIPVRRPMFRRPVTLEGLGTLGDRGGSSVSATTPMTSTVTTTVDRGGVSKVAVPVAVTPTTTAGKAIKAYLKNMYDNLDGVRSRQVKSNPNLTQLRSDGSSITMAQLQKTDPVGYKALLNYADYMASPYYSSFQPGTGNLALTVEQAKKSGFVALQPGRLQEIIDAWDAYNYMMSVANNAYAVADSHGLYHHIKKDFGDVVSGAIGKAVEVGVPALVAAGITAGVASAFGVGPLAAGNSPGAVDAAKTGASAVNDAASAAASDAGMLPPPASVAISPTAITTQATVTSVAPATLESAVTVASAPAAVTTVSPSLIATLSGAAKTAGAAIGVAQTGQSIIQQLTGGSSGASLSQTGTAQPGNTQSVVTPANWVAQLTTGYTPWILGAMALGGVALFASGRHRRK